MSILESLKGDARMSFGHWRYRLLHWAFSVEDPDPNFPMGTGLPKFLYTHYCPLFHLTNLIALLSPLILGIKVARAVGRAAALTARTIRLGPAWARLRALAARLAPERKERAEPGAGPADLAAEKKKFARRLADLCERWTAESYRNFVAVWDYLGEEFRVLTTAQAEALHAALVPRFDEAREKARARREKLRRRLVFWSNFSGVFVKWGMYALYAGLTAGVLYGLVWFLPHVWDFLCWAGSLLSDLFTTETTVAVLWFVVKAALWAGAAAGLTYGLTRLPAFWRFAGHLGAGLKVVGYPLYLLPAVGGWVASAARGAREFVHMFYEENCPAITLVTDEEAAVEAAAEKAAGA